MPKVSEIFDEREDEAEEMMCSHDGFLTDEELNELGFRTGFEDFLSECEMNARTQWEFSFIEDIANRYAYEGGDLVLSDAQLEKLNAIASGTNSTRHIRF